jgi:hypothetical protein
VTGVRGVPYPTQTPDSHHSDILAGLRRNYQIRELHPNAAVALDRLRAERKRVEQTSSRCRCGQPVNSWIAVACRQCRERCSHIAVPAYLIQRDGRPMPRSHCGMCGERLANPGRGSWLYGYCFIDNRVFDPPEPCERCGSSDGTQQHHWAPYAVFLDADSWPTSWLCPECHALWHAAMRAAGGHALSQLAYRSYPDRPAVFPAPWHGVESHDQPPGEVSGAGGSNEANRSCGGPEGAQEVGRRAGEGTTP